MPTSPWRVIGNPAPSKMPPFAAPPPTRRFCDRVADQQELVLQETFHLSCTRLELLLCFSSHWWFAASAFVGRCSTSEYWWPAKVTRPVLRIKSPLHHFNACRPNWCSWSDSH